MFESVMCFAFSNISSSSFLSFNEANGPKLWKTSSVLFAFK